MCVGFQRQLHGTIIYNDSVLAVAVVKFFFTIFREHYIGIS
jgi:hypothetical protein